MSKEITFYHLTSTPLEKALPHLMFKIYESGSRALIVCENEEQMKALDHILWSFSTKKFIPHGTVFEENSEQQPILLSDSLDTLTNNPDIAVILNGCSIESDNNFKKYMYMFYGNKNDKEVISNYSLMNVYKKLGYRVKLWTLDAKGTWVTKD